MTKCSKIIEWDLSNSVICIVIYSLVSGKSSILRQKALWKSIAHAKFPTNLLMFSKVSVCKLLKPQFYAYILQVLS